MYMSDSGPVPQPHVQGQHSRGVEASGPFNWQTIARSFFQMTREGDKAVSQALPERRAFGQLGVGFRV